MATIKADLHMHGPIGFQPHWIRVQGYNGKNLLKEIADSCFNKGVGLTAITSDEDEIPRNSIHDRFNFLKNNYTKSLPKRYEHSELGKNVLVIKRGDSILYIVNGQSVRANDGGRQVNYNVLGTNEIPNHKDIGETIKSVYNKDILIGGAEQGNHRISEEGMAKLVKSMSFIEGHDSQFIFQVPLFIPVVGNYRRELNKISQEIAGEYGKPWIAVSNAHRIEDAGISYIEFDSERLDNSDGYKFWTILRGIVESGNFKKHCEYQNLSGWADWVAKFAVGVNFGLDKKSEREDV